MEKQKPKYTVEVYDNYDTPSERCCSVLGKFDTADEAIACAKSLVDASLQSCKAASAEK